MSRVEAQVGQRHEERPDTVPELDEAVLIEAAQSYFPNGVPISPAACAERVRQFYETLDLDDRTDRWAKGDEALLRTIIPFLCKLMVRSSMPEHGKRLLIVGCGIGRLAETYIELAAQHGFEEVIFNDLFPAHIAATRAKIATMGILGRRVQSSFIAGNFSNVIPPQPADVAIAMFFVTSEVCNIQSPDALLATRHQFYRSISRNLRPEGLFVEDIPERDLPNFYASLGTISERILRTLRVMSGVEGYLSLSCRPSSMSISPSAGWMMLYSGRRCARPFTPLSPKGGPTRCARSTPASVSIPSRIISGMPGAAMPA